MTYNVFSGMLNPTQSIIGSVDFRSHLLTKHARSQVNKKERLPNTMNKFSNSSKFEPMTD